MTYSERLNNAIPGGAHTYSRGDDQYPNNAPEIFSRSWGAYAYTPDNKEFLDYGMGLRSVTLGYAYQTVTEAAIQEIMKGNTQSRPSFTELEAAEAMIELIPSAEMVKFAKNGSTVTSAAVKLARAYTGRKYIARCIDHPFFSYDDWFIGNTEIRKGIPEEVSELTVSFKFNDLNSLKILFDQYYGKIACVILEPATHNAPELNFLQEVKKLCHKNGALFILDEMITGFRWHLQGAQTYYGVEPDLATFGKGMANGFSVAALVGKREFMSLGGIKRLDQERVFLISTTHGAEMCGLGAFLATLKTYREKSVIDHLWDFGEKLVNEINQISIKLGINKYFYLSGIPCSPVYFTKNKDGEISLPMRTLFLQEMIKNKILMPFISHSFSHGELELEKTLSAVEKSLKTYMYALENGVEKYLLGPSVKPVFRKYN